MLLRPLDLQVPPLAGTKITGEKVSEPARREPVHGNRKKNFYGQSSVGGEKLNKYVRPISF
jgi:hypothetical protein